MGPELGGRKEPPGDDEKGPHDENCVQGSGLRNLSPGRKRVTAPRRNQWETGYISMRGAVDT